MKELLISGLPWFLSLTTITSVLIAGNKDRRGWAIGFTSQAVWLLWILLSASWGLLPMNIVLTVVYIRNYRAWKPDVEEVGMSRS